jgi:PTH1 family peptidyl-tRNA hydrolase
MLIVGLGNPGPEYAATRHNVGFLVVDRLLERATGGGWQRKFSGDFSQVELGGRRLYLLKPQTFMNRSGRAVGAAASFYKVPPTDVLVVHDELDVPFATQRLKRGGGEAGHNGLRSVTEGLGSKDYVRLRFGVGKPGPEFRGSGADFVLQGFAPTERATLDDLVERAADAVALVVDRGVDEAMNAINRREPN